MNKVECQLILILDDSNTQKLFFLVFFVIDSLEIFIFKYVLVNQITISQQP